MAQNSQQNVPTDQFLMIGVNLLHRQFIAAGRTSSKRTYREIEAGTVKAMAKVKMEDESTIQFNVALDYSEFRGQLNFGAFKASLSILLGNLANALEEKTKVAVFGAGPGTNAGSVLFGITGVTVDNELANVMVLGCDVGEEPGIVTLKLMYLNPEQFTQHDGGDSAAPVA